MRIGIATDHGGFWLKGELLGLLRAAGHEVVDFGAHRLNSEDDYPDFVTPLARSVAAGEVERGVAVCGSGVGARLERDEKGDKKLGEWDWFSNPFVGTKELNGLRVMMALINNWNPKSVNNSIRTHQGTPRTYYVMELDLLASVDL